MNKIYNYFNLNQINTKKFNFKHFKLLKTIEIKISLFNINSLINFLILESLFLLEFFTAERTAINSYQQKYKTINLEFIKHVNNFEYFLKILKLFYLPNFKRQNILVFFSQIFSSKFVYSVSNINLIPFLPNVYFKWKLILNHIYFFNKQSQEQMFLFLCYLGFYFEEEQEYSTYTKLTSNKFINEFIS